MSFIYNIFFFWIVLILEIIKSKMTHPVQLPIPAKKQDKRVMRVKVGSNGEKKELDKIWKIGGGGGGGGVDNLGREVIIK